MGTYVLRRLLLIVPTFLIIVTAVFALMRLMPGDPIGAIFTESRPHPDEIARVKAELGLDKPIYVQYGQWLVNVAQGDFGTSLNERRPVLSILKERAPNSLKLGLLALIIGWSIAIPIGVLAAVKRDSSADYVARSLAILLLSIPNFWMALVIIIVPAVLFGVFLAPSYVPFSDDPLAHLRFFLLPALILGVHLTGTTMRMTRAMMLEVLYSDYIRTARAKGLRERAVIFRHAMKNALIPVVTIIGRQAALIVGGTVIIEQIFSVPGVGQLTYQAVNQKDFVVVQAVVVVLALFVLVTNLLIDLTYGWLDPRISYR